MAAYAKPEDLAELFGKSTYWVLEQCRAGRFPHLRVGVGYRFKPEHVAAIEKQMERPARDAESTSNGRLPGVRSRARYAKAPP